MRVLYNSVSPLTMSGYGRCTAELVYRLLQWYDIDIAAYYGVQQSDITITLDGKHGPRDVRVIGGDGRVWHPLLPELQHNYDLIIFHYDLWFVWPQFKQHIKTPSIWWAIIDHDPVPHPVREILKHPALVHAVPMTNWARAQLIRACRFENLPLEIIVDPIYHGIDPDEWQPVDDPKIPGIPDGAEFVVCSVVTNHGPRENIPTMIEAFAIFLKESGADAYYYIHAEPTSETGYNIPLVIKSVEELYDVDLKNRILCKASTKRYPDEFLRNIYSRADVHLMTIMGGSFEIPILEAAMCGTPTISTNFSAMAELLGYGSRGLLVKPCGWMWMQLSSAKQAVVNPYDVADALMKYYYEPELRQKHVKKMRVWILENATWDIVSRKWKKLIDSVVEYLEVTKC